ncbi:cadherin-related family member 5 isoform X3 [Platichthys flesus]|uniref:cadherin-related family member 5 isoform X3 n=1 Tax=Platichthys flesus TaxID=8260 RepID=UPI002DB69454|nr:cadherin-related family member 5 isoform X3 [Platichthys flesus]
MLRRCRLLLWQVVLQLSYHVVTAGPCQGGSDILASVRENSPLGQFIANISISGERRVNTIRLCLSGPSADWFYLEGRTIRLNTSLSRVLDREVQGSVLVAELTCYEEDVMQSQFRILVEIVNENDNRPNFLQETIGPFSISELTAVNSVIFTVKAVDADGDMITYIIDQSSPDAAFFRIDLPNSGSIVLDKHLDFETRHHLEFIIWAQESNTEDKFNSSSHLSVNIEDGDDQYPHFLPCSPVAPGVPICINPAYTTNITHRTQDVVLEFSPGPIRAVDGDRGINMSLIYSILSGDNQGRFEINNTTGELRLTRAVDGRRLTPNFTLKVMGLNPNIRYSLHPLSDLYHVTQMGILIARTYQLHDFDRHILQVVARDEESGEEVSASVDIEVLQRGQEVPHGAFTEQQMFGDVDTRLAGGVAVLITLMFLSALLFLLLRSVKR